jgi:TRAP-type transport system small permease protein
MRDNANAVDRLVAGFLALLGIILIGLVLLGVYNVVSRYAFGRAVLWADEAAVFGMIVLTWFGAAVSFWKGTEIRMDILSASVSAPARRVLLVIQEFLMVCLMGGLAWQSFNYVLRVFRFGMRSDSTGLPLWIVHASIALSLAAIAIISVFRLFRLLSPRGRTGDASGGGSNA